MLSPRKHPCRTPTCSNLVRSGYCEACRTPANQRPSAAKRGYGRPHRRWRAQVLERDPICRKCGKEPSIEAHHIIPIGRGGAPLDINNGMGLGKVCHAQITREMNR